MEWKHRKQALWRIPALIMVITALFWTIWYAIAGNIPEMSAIPMNSDWNLQLPFAVSRWLDIPCAGIVALALTAIFTSPRILVDNGQLILGLVFGLFVGLILGLAFGLPIELGVGLSYGMIFVLVAALVWGLIFIGIFGVSAGPGYGIGLVLSYGLIFGLSFIVGTGLVFGLVYGLIFIFRPLFNKSLWRVVGRWLIGKPTQ